MVHTQVSNFSKYLLCTQHYWDSDSSLLVLIILFF